jgi:glyoxylase-like metal-dependent hydrolase (beta-lactamase superfamily II)
VVYNQFVAKVDVLIEGYAREVPGGWLASGTTTLIESLGKLVIVDPGTNRQRLLAELSERKLTPENMDFVFMTHYHPDHNLLTGIFPKAIVYDDTLFYDGDRQTDHEGTIAETDIRILKTPGHESFHGSLIVPSSAGTVVVAGDVFWWSESEGQITDQRSLLGHKDPFVKDEAALLTSRKEILAIADWIIPGHGKMFRNVRTK